MRRRTTASSAVALLALLAAGCGTAPAKDDPPKRKATGVGAECYSTDWQLHRKRWRVPPGVDVGVVTMHLAEKASLHGCLVVGAQDLHRHDKSDETMVIVEGEGTLVTSKGEEKVGAGQVVHIPQGVAHALRCDPAASRNGVPLAVLLVFSPQFQDGDQLAGAAASETGRPTIVTLESGGEPSPPATQGTEVARGPNASVHVVRTSQRIPLHIHEARAETLFVYEGQGVTRLGDGDGGERPASTRAGTIIHIPARREHAFEHETTVLGVVGKDTRAVSIFSPAFDGKDRLMIEDPKLAPPKPKSPAPGQPDQGGAGGRMFPPPGGR